MVLDDSNWFAAQKRIRAELEPMADEMRKINCAVEVQSDHERDVALEISIWNMNRPYIVGQTVEQLIKEFWNERLN